MLSPGSVLQNRYRVVRRVGYGGMGAVYEAQHEELSHTVALKETLHTDDDSLRRAFKREARMLVRLKHSSLPHGVCWNKRRRRWLTQPRVSAKRNPGYFARFGCQ